MTSQAERIISKFGSSYRLAKVLTQVLDREVYTSTVCRWRRNGTIPQRMHVAVFAAAVHCKITLNAEDFMVFDRSIDDSL